MNWRIPLSDMKFGDEEKQAVARVLESGWLTMGEITEQFENEFAAFIGAKYAIAVTNGTASLHLACRALDLQPGDEVLVPSLTFVATSNSIIYTGATPVFVDITSENDLNISPSEIEQKITNQTKAIMVMHYAGYPCDMPAIMEIADRYNLHVIEDAAHAPGANLDQKKMGCWGDIASFSFFPNKNMTTGEGGMLVTNDESLAKKMRTLRSHGMTTLTWDRHRGHAWSYDVVDLGYNYRIDEIRSAIGREQLKKLPHNNLLRKQMTAYYRSRILATNNGLATASGLTVPFFNSPGESTCHIMPVLLPIGADRSQFVEAMKSMGIQTSLHYPPIHQFKYYRENNTIPHPKLPLTEEIAEREVTLPLYPTIREEDIDYIVSAIYETLKQVNHPIINTAHS